MRDTCFHSLSDSGGVWCYHESRFDVYDMVEHGEDLQAGRMDPVVSSIDLVS